MQTFLPPFGMLKDINPLINNVFQAQNKVPGTPSPPVDEFFRITDGGDLRITDGDDSRITD